MTNQNSRIVVGYDGSPDADFALTWAAESARAQDRPVEVVIVAAPPDFVIENYLAVLERAVKRWRSAALDLMETLKVGDGVVHVRRGPVLAELIAAADGAAMLVVGSSGHALVTGTTIGSVSQHAARHASCPVVVVR